jgi:hypothetical protein
MYYESIEAGDEVWKEIDKIHGSFCKKKYYKFLDLQQMVWLNWS